MRCRRPRRPLPTWAPFANGSRTPAPSDRRRRLRSAIARRPEPRWFMTISMITSGRTTTAALSSAKGGRSRRGLRSTRFRRPISRQPGEARISVATGRAQPRSPDFLSSAGPGGIGNRSAPLAAFAKPRSQAYIFAMRETMTAAVPATMPLDEIVDNFSLLEEWDDRYRYLIELGRGLAPLSEGDRTDANKVQGCASQVWLATTVRPNGGGGPTLSFSGDSDAHIVRGLIAILFAMFSGRRAREILSTDAIILFERLGLREHLTPQRSNGFRSMVERIRSDARAALGETA